jgi:hypothetical protein
VVRVVLDAVLGVCALSAGLGLEPQVLDVVGTADFERDEMVDHIPVPFATRDAVLRVDGLLDDARDVAERSRVTAHADRLGDVAVGESRVRGPG